MTEADSTGTASEPGPGGLVITATAACGVHALSLAGEIDHHSGTLLQQILNDIEGPCPRIVLDLRQVTFLDSSALNIFLTTHHLLTAAGGWLRLAAPTEAVLHTLNLAGIGTVIPCHTTLRQALGA